MSSDPDLDTDSVDDPFPSASCVRVSTCDLLYNYVQMSWHVVCDTDIRN